MLIANPFQSYSEQQDRLRALYDLALELSALRDLPTVLDTALRHCLELTESQFGFVGLTASNGKAMDVVAIHGFPPAAEFYEQAHLIPLRPNVFARVVLENRPIRSADAMTDEHRVGQPAGHPPVHAFLGVPLRIREEPIGMIGVANRPVPYVEGHEQLLVTYAAQVAIAIHNAKLNEALAATQAELERKVAERTEELGEARDALAQKAGQLQRLLAETVTVQERERQRISQDLHDGLNQLLVGAMLELKSGRERLSRTDMTGAELSFQRVGEILHRVEGELRQTIYDLRPPVLDALGLVPSLRRHAEHFARHTGIECEVIQQGTPYRLLPDAEIGLYRIVQEALQNVGLHSEAGRATVTVEYEPDILAVMVGDDGQGFDLSTVASNGHGHFGLMSMQERAESFGGRLAIHTRPGQGTRVEAWFPIP
jgi:signal transduction histidine kinase